MRHFSIQETSISGVKLICPFVADDERGRFIKDYSSAAFESLGIAHELHETFYASNKQAGIIRGLHFLFEKPQAKLVRCITGAIYDVVVDLRKESPTFGRWQGFHLSADPPLSLLVPGYCAHGYVTLEPAIVSYKCDTIFDPECDDGIKWNDEELAIQWPQDITSQLVISPKDASLRSFADFRRCHGGFSGK